VYVLAVVGEVGAAAAFDPTAVDEQRLVAAVERAAQRREECCFAWKAAVRE
jgi:hypothetical protein